MRKKAGKENGTQVVGKSGENWNSTNKIVKDRQKEKKIMYIFTFFIGCLCNILFPRKKQQIFMAWTIITKYDKMDDF